MKQFCARVLRGARQAVRWYVTPAGLLSAAALVLAALMVSVGRPGAGVAVLAVWLAVVLPYKLQRESADRVAQGARLSTGFSRLQGRVSKVDDGVAGIERDVAGLERGVARVGGEVARLEKDVSAVRSDVSLTPTTADLIEWQNDLDRRVTAVESKMAAIGQDSEALRHHRDATHEIVEQQRAIREELDRRLAALRGDMDALQAWFDAEVADRIRSAEERSASDAASLAALYAILEVERPLPSFTSWALSPAAALVVVEAVVETRAGLVVEAGSGSSTVVIALALAKQGHGRVVALEHDPAFAEKTQRELQRFGVEDFADVVLAPLVDHVVHGETYRWYSLDGIDVDAPIDVLLVDGPPGSTGPLARYPAVPILARSFADGALVLLDDVDRDDEQQIAQRWSDQFDLTLAMGLADGVLGRGSFRPPRAPARSAS